MIVTRWFIICCHHGKAIARVHPVLLMNTVPCGYQANQLGLWVRWKSHLPSASTTTIYYYSAEKLLLIYHPTKGRRLSWSRHCVKGVRPVPKAVYCGGCRDKHDCPRWHSNPGSSRTAVRHVTNRPLWHCIVVVFIWKCIDHCVSYDDDIL